MGDSVVGVGLAHMDLRPDAVVDFQDGSVAVIRHDARALPLEDGSVDLIVTSPPYFALRSYRDDGEHYDGQIGSEPTPDEFLDNLDACMAEWGRVLKPSGSVWVNLGDKYATGQFGDTGGDSDALGYSYRGGKSGAQNMDEERRTPGEGLARRKSLMGLPWRFAIRQIDAGWILRAEVVWSKPNGLPESVTDRVRRSHEQWFHFTKEPRYFSAVDEIREPQMFTGGEGSPNQRRISGNGIRHREFTSNKADYNPLGRLPGSVWDIPSEPLLIPDDTRELLDLPDHFAAFPQEFPRRIIQGWSPSGVCVECGEGRRPVVEKEANGVERADSGGVLRRYTGAGLEGNRAEWAENVQATIIGYACACPTPDPPTTPSVILDPFGGTGTVAGVAKTLGRFGISNDLSESYNRLAIWRINDSGHFSKTEQRTWAARQGTMNL